MASIGQLAARVAYEIKNPMGFIIRNLNTLKRHLEKGSECLTVQSDAMQRCSSKCGNSDILSVAQLEKEYMI